MKTFLLRFAEHWRKWRNIASWETFKIPCVSCSWVSVNLGLTYRWMQEGNDNERLFELVQCGPQERTLGRIEPQVTELLFGSPQFLLFWFRLGVFCFVLFWFLSQTPKILSYGNVFEQFCGFKAKLPQRGTLRIHTDFIIITNFLFYVQWAKRVFKGLLPKIHFPPWNIHLSNSATYPRLMINYLDNCFNSLLHFANAELAFVYRFIASFMFFRE